MRFFDLIPTIGRITSSTRKRLTLVLGLIIPLCAVKAWSTPESMLMKWCAGRPKSMTFAADMQMSAFAARRFSRVDLLKDQ